MCIAVIVEIGGRQVRFVCNNVFAMRVTRTALYECKPKFVRVYHIDI